MTAVKCNNSAMALPPTLVRANHSEFVYRQKSGPASSNLKLLTYGTYELGLAAESDELCQPYEETLLFCLNGLVEATIDKKKYQLKHYDLVYIPRGTSYRLRNIKACAEAKLVICKAPAEHRHPIYMAHWEAVRKNKKRIRLLKGKKVYLMFDVGEAADRLVAGYTIYEPHSRAYPPHNHTDQEEIYIFPQGHGAIEVYANEESKTFVHSLDPGDAVTIPVLNYHPVFSQEEELHFIWCIAGERYWVGDKNQDFLKGTAASITT